MILLIEQQKEVIAELCRRYNIERLHVFGSAAGDCFDDQRSDLDFLVKMSQRELPQAGCLSSSDPFLAGSSSDC
jgi:hypothetical protein